MTVLIRVVLILLALGLPALAQDAAPPPPAPAGGVPRTTEPTPEQLRALADLFRDPAMQDWLARRAGEETPPAAPTSAPSAASQTGAAPASPPAAEPAPPSTTTLPQAPASASPAAPAVEAPGEAQRPASPSNSPVGPAVATVPGADATPAMATVPATEGTSATAPVAPAPAPSSAVTPGAAPAAPAVAAAAAEDDAGGTVQAAAHDALVKARAFLGGVVAAAPTLPGELDAAADRLAAEVGDRGGVLVRLAAFLLLGVVLEALVRRTLRPLRRRIDAIPADSVATRLAAARLRLVEGLVPVAAFGVGCLGAFLLFAWPPLLGEIVLAALAVVLTVRAVMALGRVVLAPDQPRLRMVPLSTAAARFWFVWTAVIVGWFRLVETVLEVLHRLGVAKPAAGVVGLAGGLVLVALALAVLWRRPAAEGTPAVAAPGARLRSAALSLYIVVVWLMLFSGSVAPFYIGLVLLLLPLALRTIRAAAAHLVRPPDAPADVPFVAPAHTNAPPLRVVTAERVLRAAVLIAAAYFVAWQVGLDLDEMSNRDTLFARLLRGAVNAFAVVLLADLAWHVARAWIDGRLADAAAGTHGGTGSDPHVPHPHDVRRKARLRTLLPMLRNMLLVTIFVVGLLMALTSLGVNVAPLIAGAGVVGVAVGFGAQSLVKDLIAGMFFLVDDAFRVGEYIESGSIRGTVETFSLRSIKLRHQRGALHTIPFGSIEKITNYSRDWTIDKISVSVNYDTDLEKAKKIIKKIGAELQADPELGPSFLEPLKMQGVGAFGDYGIELQLKMMTKPGENFPIRRRAYAMIRKAFAENGIELSSPTVRVAGGGGAAAAAEGESAATHLIAAAKSGEG